MICLARYSRVLTLTLCIFYVFTGSGLDKVTYQCASLINRMAVFPCKGKGCQCDKAGYELSNCKCDHNNAISCCEPEPAPVAEEKCCSDETISSNCDSISNIPCQGVEEDSIYSLAKHLIFLPHIEKAKKYFNNSNKTPYSVSINEADSFPLDKIPIYS